MSSASGISRLLYPLVGIVLLATLMQGLTSFALTQTLSKAAQKLIAELRRQVQEHVGRLSGLLLRRQQDRHAGVAHHERRGRRAQPGRHRTGGLRRRAADGGDRLCGADSHQPGDDRDRLRLPAGLWSWPAQGVPDHPADFPRARQDQCRGDRPPDRVAGRRARGEGLPRRSSASTRSSARAWSACCRTFSGR